jgi:hypothetical protein
MPAMIMNNANRVLEIVLIRLIGFFQSSHSTQPVPIGVARVLLVTAIKLPIQELNCPVGTELY